MSRIAYVNGRYVPLSEAAVSIEDRGFQFADGVYEYFSVFDGHLADAKGHLERLWRSLGELRIPAPMSEAALRIVMAQTARLSRVRQGSITPSPVPPRRPASSSSPSRSISPSARPVQRLASRC